MEFVDDLMIILLVVVTLYSFHSKKSNREKFKNPSFSNIDLIIDRYYSNYFYKFLNYGDYPSLNEIYKSMLSEFRDNEISKETLKLYAKYREKSPKQVFISKFFNYLISFLGVTQISNVAKFLEVSKISEIDQIPEKLKKIFIDLFSSDIYDKLSEYKIGIVALFLILLYVFLLKIDAPKVRLRNSQEAHLQYILEDLLMLYDEPGGLELSTTIRNSFTDSFQLELFKISVLKYKEHYKFFIPPSIASKELREQTVAFSDENPRVKIEKDGITYTLNLKIDNSEVVLENIKNQNGETSFRDNLENFKFVISVLSRLADIKYNQENSFGRKISDWVTGNANEGRITQTLRNMAVVICVTLIVFLGAIGVIFLAITKLYYAFILLYFFWYFSDWLIRKMY